MVEHSDSVSSMQLGEGGQDAGRSKDEAAEPAKDSNLEGQRRTPSRSKKRDLGKLPVVQEAKQWVFARGSTVYFTAFTKSRDHGKLEQHLYFCEGTVVEEPSQYTRAPHKVVIRKVAFYLSKDGCSEADGRTLLNKEIHLPSDKIVDQIPLILSKSKWWI